MSGEASAERTLDARLLCALCELGQTWSLLRHCASARWGALAAHAQQPAAHEPCHCLTHAV